MRIFRIVFTCFCITLSILAFSQDTVEKNDSSSLIENSPPVAQDYGENVTPIKLNRYLFYSGISIGLLVLVFLFTITYVAVKSNQGFSDRYYRLCAILLIAGLASIITVSGYSSEQMGGALGLLGTIAGYLLGKGDKINDNDINK